MGSDGPEVKAPKIIKDVCLFLLGIGAADAAARCSADQMDEQRQEKIAYEYLCHLEELKKWIETCIRDELPEPIQLEESLRNGVYLARLANRFDPEGVPLKKIYDFDQTRYRDCGLTFRHTDNINHWLRTMLKLGLPAIFLPETTDLYDRKNMPRVVYCIHALSLFLYRLGKAPQMPNLFGKAQFSEDVVRAMSRELQKYGFPLPQFGKIGGILANELPVSEAERHASIIAINRATEQGECLTMITAMEHPAAQLRDIEHSLANLYLQTLTDALNEKKQLAAERSLNSSYTPDVYDELLTGEEIQAQIDCVNEFSALEKVALAVEQSDSALMMSALRNPILSVARLRPDLASSYFQALASVVASKGIERCDLQSIVDRVNADHESFRERDQHVKAINKSLASVHRDATRTLVMLRQLFEKTSGTSDEFSNLTVLDMAAPLYHEEMANFRQMTEEDLNFQMICGAVRTLTRVAQVTQAVESRNVADLLFVLEDPLLGFEGFNSSMTTDYLVALGDMRREKVKAREFCPVLTHIEIQQCITQVNEGTSREDTAVLIHRAVDEGKIDQLTNLLVDADLVDDGDRDVQSLGPLYMRMLRTLVQAKMRRTDQNQTLSIGDVEEVIVKANEFIDEARQALSVACAINNLRDAPAFIEGLDSGYLRIPEMSRNQFQTCMKRLETRTQGLKIEQLPLASAWVSHRLTQGIPAYLNVQNRTIRWEKPPAFDPSTKLIGIQEFEELVTCIVHRDEVERLEQAIEPVVTRLQAYARGFLVREHLALRLSHFHDNVDAVVRIQTWWRQVVQRRRYLQELRRRHEQEQNRDLNFYRRYLKQIIRIQAWCRRWLAMRSFRAIKRGDMPLSTLRRFLHLLDIGQRDYDEEMQVQLLKNDVMQTIRRNKQLEKDLNSMDIKIGLLVKNQIALQEVVAHGHKLRKHVSKVPDHNKENSIVKSATESHGHSRPGIELLSLTQKGRHKLESYQHLFYLLQTEPRYLAKLLFLQPQKFPETMVLALYNYGSNLREEYLLLKLFRCALEEEVRHKVDSLNDAATGNTLVVKLIIQLSRQGHRVSQLRDMLGPIVERILKENVFINLSPVEIYKLWINQLESASGQPCGMPYEVNAEQALKHQEVQRRLKSSIEFLKNATSLFLNEITSSIRNIPYGKSFV